MSETEESRRDAINAINAKHMPEWAETRCERCDQALDPSKAIWLELHVENLTWHAAGDALPPEVSQGCFPFGAACARRALVEGVAR